MIIAAPFPKGCPQLEHSFLPLTDLQDRNTNKPLQPVKGPGYMHLLIKKINKWRVPVLPSLQNLLPH